ncbi:MAG: xanthine dehydrogenase family protein subunit M [Candidatus Methanomethyliaceae archaeon]
MQSELRPLGSFEYYAPVSVAEVVNLLSVFGEESRLLAGGTDLLPQMRMGKQLPKVIIDLRKLGELRYVKEESSLIRIGACTTLTEVANTRCVQSRLPVLVEAINQLGCIEIRNRATIGGNLCNASPAADTAPALLVLDAHVKLVGLEGERVVPLSEFFLGPGKTIMRRSELMTEVIVPVKEKKGGFLKLGRRHGFTLSLISVSASVQIQDGVFRDVRVAMGAIAPTPVRCQQVEAILEGEKVSEEVIERAALAAKEEVNPSRETGKSREYRRATDDYRREMAYVLVKRILKKLTEVGI